MDDHKVATDEARRVAQHEAVKARVQGNVKAAITGQAGVTTPDEEERIAHVAGDLRGKAIEETVDTEHAVQRARGAARGSQIVDYIFYVIYTLLGVRLVLALIAASSQAGFVRFIKAVTGPLYAPFRGIVPSPTVEGGSTLALPIVIAIAAYILLHIGINAFLRMIVHRKTEI